MLKTITLPATTGNVGEMLSSQLAKQRLERRKCFLKLLSNVRFLARQGLAFRGDGNESDSNFMQLRILHLRLLELWDESLETVRETEMKARIQGVAAQMKKFEFFFGVSLGLLILRHTDNLSRTMQRADMSAAEGQEVMCLTLSTLKSLRNDFSFDQFW